MLQGSPHCHSQRIYLQLFIPQLVGMNTRNRQLVPETTSHAQALHKIQMKESALKTRNWT